MQLSCMDAWSACRVMLGSRKLNHDADDYNYNNVVFLSGILPNDHQWMVGCAWQLYISLSFLQNNLLSEQNVH